MNPFRDSRGEISRELLVVVSGAYAASGLVNSPLPKSYKRSRFIGKMQGWERGTENGVGNVARHPRVAQSSHATSDRYRQTDIAESAACIRAVHFRAWIVLDLAPSGPTDLRDNRDSPPFCPFVKMGNMSVRDLLPGWGMQFAAASELISVVNYTRQAFAVYSQNTRVF